MTCTHTGIGENDQAWGHSWDHVDAGGPSRGAHLRAEREHLTHEQAEREEHAQEPVDDEGAA